MVTCVTPTAKNEMVAFTGMLRRKPKPVAVMRWDEHVRLNVKHKAWGEEIIPWLAEQGIPAYALDHAYFSHYEGFSLDQLQRGSLSMISRVWDDLSGDPISWFDSEVPKFTQASVAYQRALLDEARKEEPIVKPGYVLLWGQQNAALCRINLKWKGETDGTTRWYYNVCKALMDHGERPVVKLSPIAHKITHPPQGVEAIRHDRKNVTLNANLIVNAKYHVINASSVSNELTIAGAPVIATGSSWFSGLNVFHEVKTIEEIGSQMPVVDEGARNKWMRWWIWRQTSLFNFGNTLVKFAKTAPQYF